MRSLIQIQHFELGAEQMVLTGDNNSTIPLYLKVLS